MKNLDNKTVFMFAGANGSGKSTRARATLESQAMPSNFICPDNYVDSNNATKEQYIEAMKTADAARKSAVEQGISFSFETVFSRPEKLDFLKHCKENGYTVFSTYIATKTPFINIRRIAERVSQGGHNVPRNKVINRYYKSMRLLPEIIKISDVIIVLDNSGQQSYPVFIKAQGTMILLNKNKRHKWVDKYIISIFKDEIVFDFNDEDSLIFNSV